MLPILFGLGILGLFAVSRRPTVQPARGFDIEAVDVWDYDPANPNKRPVREVTGRASISNRPYRRGDFLRMLNRVVKANKQPPRWLVCEATREAYELGDWRAVTVITNAFQTQSPRQESPQQAQPQTDIPAPTPRTSPLDGVTDDEWSQLVEALRVQKPEFATDNHLGAYYHSRDRLDQLGIDGKTLDTEAAQYQALATDLAAYKLSERNLINDMCGDMVSVQGQQHPVTMSGVLGLLKAAGPKHAKSWFKSETDRLSHPHTTETFLKTNGIF